MLEFLKDCNKNNIYERAMACESHLNDFDSIIPMAVFFETALKSICAELYNKNIEHIRFVDLLQDLELKEYLQRKYHFEDPDSIINNLIRLHSNSYKHSLETHMVTPSEVQVCFQCVFDFAACYYAVKTKSPVPKWNDKEYQSLLERTIDTKAREKLEQDLKEEILHLRDECEEQKKQLCILNKELEKQKAMDEAELLQQINPKERDVLQTLISELETKMDNYQIQIIKLEEYHKKKEQEQEKQENAIKSVQVRAERSDTETAKLLRQEYKQLATDLQQTRKVIDGLVRQKEELQTQYKTALADKETAQQKLEELGRFAASPKLLARIEKEQKEKNKKRNRLQQKLEKSSRKLKKKEGRLCITNGELEEVNQKYIASHKEIARLYEEKNEIEQQIGLPKWCEHCGSLMNLKKKNGYFWACSAYKSDGSGCKSHTRPALPYNRYDTLVQKLEQLNEEIDRVRAEKFTIPSSVFKQYQTKFMDFKAYPYSFATEVSTRYLFQSLAVPPEVFEHQNFVHQKEDFLCFSRFYMCCNMERSKVPLIERTIYSLVLRLLDRGVVLPASIETASRLRNKFNKQKTGNVNMLFDYIQYCHPENHYDSEREQKFAEYWFPKLLGQSWATYVFSQISFDALVPMADKKDKEFFYGQRADFLVSKNGKKIVIELDGPEHALSVEKDRARDEFLQKWNYEVLRFRNNDVDRRDPDILTRLNSALGQNQVSEKDIGLVNDHYLVACKLAHQFGIAVAKALEQGYISRDCHLCVSATASIFSASELQFILTVAMAELQQLFENYAVLYGLETEWNLLGGKGVNVMIALGDGNCGQHNIIIRDCCLSYNYLCDIEPLGNLGLPQNCSQKILEFFLEYLFGYNKFRQGQYDAVCRLLTQKDSIIILPTGAGKSIIYQLASFLVPGIIVVISPLVSLIQDQIMNLESRRGINNALAIVSAVTADEFKAREEAVFQMEHNVLSLLYISPERLAIPSFRDNVKKMMIHNQVYAVSIDEAHCVSEWGHDFRPAYLNIGRTSRKLFQKNGRVPVLAALTGTASDAVLKDIQRNLGIADPDALVLPYSFDRKELHFRVYQCESRDKDIKIADIIKNKLPEFFGITFEEFMRRNGSNTKAGIIFTPLAASKRPGKYDAASIQMRLMDMLPETSIAAYFSRVPDGYSEEDWKVTIAETAKRFKENELNLLVATKAFGMGIDKENIRYIIHDGIPSSFEQYYQEAGRAGRASQKENGNADAECILLLSAGNEAHNMELLDPSLTLMEFTDKFHKYKKMNGYERDDLNAILYFHTESYKGINYECMFANGILDLLSHKKFNSGQQEKLFMTAFDKNNNKDNKNRLTKAWLQAMVRFSILGIIQDYTYDYNNTFILVLGSLEQESIIKHYLDYVSYISDNSQGRRKSENQKIIKIQESGINFAKAAVRILIEYIYDNIEKSRRRAIREMYTTAKKAAELPIGEQDKFFRQRILTYFSYEGVKKNDLQKILSSENSGVHILPEIFPLPKKSDTFDKKNQQSSREIHIAAGRMLESRPDHPGLLLVQAMAEIIMGDYSVEFVARDVTAAIRYADERYSIPRKILFPVLQHVLKLALYTSGTMFDELADSVSKAGFKRKTLIEPIILDKNLGNTQRDYLLCVYMIDQTTQFLKGETES